MAVARGCGEAKRRDEGCACVWVVGGQPVWCALLLLAVCF